MLAAESRAARACASGVHVAPISENMRGVQLPRITAESNRGGPREASAPRRRAELPLLACASLLVACFGGGPPRPPPPQFKDVTKIPSPDLKAVQVRGRVLDPRGLPAANLEVFVVGGGHTGSRVRSDANGMFSAAGLPATDDGLIVISDERYAVLVREGVKLREREPASVSLRLEPAKTIAGRVLDERGAPLAHAIVEARGTRLLTGRVRRGSSYECVAGVDRVETDDEGRFRFAQLYPGDFELVAHWPFASACEFRSTQAAGDEQVELRLDPTASERAFVVGHVHTADGGAPLAGADVCARRADADDAHPACSTSRADGSFAIGPLEPGAYVLDATLVDGRRAWSGERTIAPGVLRLEIVPDAPSTSPVAR